MFGSAGGGGGAGAAVGVPGGAALAAALDRLLAVDPAELTDGELAAGVVALRRQQARLAAVVAQLTAAFDARGVYAADGSRSAAEWIGVRARLPRAQVGWEVCGARRLQAMPATRAAFAAGDLNAA
jgi:hypothetical protein